MQINKQRLNQWLSGEIAAYNDGTHESIAMIKELCRRSSSLSTPSGVADLYANDKKIGWYSYEGPEGGMPHQPVSWFFEPEDPRYEVKSWVCDDGIWDNWKKEFVGSPIDSRALAEKILMWFLSIEEK